MTGTNLSNSDFEGANLLNANFTNVNLANSRLLSVANVATATFTGATCPDGVKFETLGSNCKY